MSICHTCKLLSVGKNGSGGVMTTSPATNAGRYETAVRIHSESSDSTAKPRPTVCSRHYCRCLAGTLLGEVPLCHAFRATENTPEIAFQVGPLAVVPEVSVGVDTGNPFCLVDDEVLSNWSCVWM